MSIKYGFFDNQLIGVDELKDITKGIQSNGISINSEQFAVSDLNQFYEKIFTTGVVPGTDTSLQVGVSGTTITVAPGTAYFENGTFITLDAQEELTIISGAINYVYAVSDRDKGEAYLEVFTESKKNDANGGVYYVALAEISADAKTVTDKRVYAKSALAATPPANASGNYIKEVLIAERAVEGETYSLYINVNPAQYKYLQLVSMIPHEKSHYDETMTVDDNFTFLRFDISDYENKIPMVCVGYHSNYNGATSAYSEDVKNSKEGWICGTDTDYAAVSIEEISTAGIKMDFLIFTDWSSHIMNVPLKFELSLIRKDDITDETTVTIE